MLAAGAGRDRIGYRALKQLAALDPAVEAVTGFTRYRVDGDPDAARRSRSSTGAGSGASCRPAPSATTSYEARSVGWPSTARCSWHGAEPTAAP